MRATALLALGLLCGLPATADTIYLRNGNTFEGVITESGGSKVTIRLAYGELSLPLSSVDRIERETSPQEEYFARYDALARNDGAPAGEWMELARWARRAGLAHSAGEAARIAARLEPELPDLAPLMRSLGYVLDERIGRWVTHDDFMRSRGFVRDGTAWVSPEEVAARERAAAESRQARREAAREDRLTRAVELLALSQVERIEERRREPVAVVTGGLPVGVFPGGFLGGGFIARRTHHAPVIRRGAGGHHRGSFGNREVFDQLLRRQPGSLFPVGPNGPLARVHHPIRGGQ